MHNDDNRTETTFEINDYDIWKLLLTQRPKTLMELKTIKGDYIPAVKDYIDSEDILNLIEVAQVIILILSKIDPHISSLNVSLQRDQAFCSVSVNRHFYGNKQRKRQPHKQ